MTSEQPIQQIQPIQPIVTPDSTARPTVTAAMVALGASLMEPRLSPDATRLAYVVRRGGEAWLAVRDLGDAATVQVGAEIVVTTVPRIATGHPSGGGSYCWSPDGNWLVFVAREGGVWRVPSAGGPSVPVAASRSADAGLWSPVCSPDGLWVAYVEEDLDTAVVAVAPMDPVSGRPVRVTSPTEADFVMDPAWSADGRLAWHAWSVPDMPWDGGRIVWAHIALDSGVAVPAARTAITPGGAVGQPRWSPDGTLLAMVSDASGWMNVTVVHPDLPESPSASVREVAEHAEPTWGPGQRSYAWSPDGTRVAFDRNEAGFGRLCIAALGTGAVDPTRELGRGVHGGLSWGRTPGGHERIAALRQGARTPLQLVVYDANSGDRTVLAVGPVGGWDAASLPEPAEVWWTAPDGERIPGRLYSPARPEGARPPPMIVSIHGGPTAQTRVTWNGRFAYLLDRGWALLVPDHRGSTGWGRPFQQAMLGRWGDIDIEDTAAGVRHAIASGWCDPARIVPMGGSAGGFTVLGLLGRHPDLFTAGVDLYGVTDLLDLDATTHRYERHYQRSLVGERPAAEPLYMDRSPVSFASSIVAPLLVLHGDADRDVVPAQSQVLVDALRSLGRTVEFHLYEGEGHGWSKPDVVMDELARIEAFLERHAG